MSRLFAALCVGVQDALVVAGTLSLLMVQLVGFSDDPGVGWHLKTGEYVARVGIPKVDPFLAHDTVRPWVSDQWLSDLLFFKLFSAGSWPLIYGILTALFIATYFLVLYSALTRLSRVFIPVSFALLISFKIAQIHFILRPVMLSFLLLACVYVRVFKIYRDYRSGAALPAKEFVVLPAIFLVWANLHPAFAIGLFVVALLPISLIVDRMCERIKSGVFPRLGGAANATWLLAACFVATIINPYHIMLHRSIVSLSGSDFFMTFNEEWHPPAYGAFEGELFLISLALIIFSLILCGLPRWGAFEILLIASFSYFSTQAVRMLPLYGIVISLPLAEAIANYGRLKIFTGTTRFGTLFLNVACKLEAREGRTFRGGMAAWAMIGLVLLGPILYGRIPFYQGEYGPSLGKFPYGAIKFLKGQLSSDKKAVVAASPDWGGFIIFQGGERIRAIIDDRNTMLGEQFYKDFLAALKPDGDWRGYFARNQVTHLLLSRSSKLGENILQGNALPVIYEDEVSRLFRVSG